MGRQGHANRLCGNLRFSIPVDEVQIALSASLAGVIKEVVQPDLDSVGNTVVENIVMDEVIIFKTCSIGIGLRPLARRRSPIRTSTLSAA